MNLVNKQDGAFLFLKCTQNGLETLFKITTILRAGKQGTHVQRVDDAVGQYRRDFTIDDFLRQALGNGSFTNASFTNKQRVVLATTA